MRPRGKYRAQKDRPPQLLDEGPAGEVPLSSEVVKSRVGRVHFVPVSLTVKLSVCQEATCPACTQQPLPGFSRPVKNMVSADAPMWSGSCQTLPRPDKTHAATLEPPRPKQTPRVA